MKPLPQRVRRLSRVNRWEFPASMQSCRLP
jgi:hypothetical protein